MKNRKSFVTVLLIFVIALIISFAAEILIFNRNAIFNNTYNEKLKVIRTKGFTKKNNYYVSNNDDSYILLKGNKKYVNKLSFNYHSEYDFTWDYIASNKSIQKEESNCVSGIIDKTVRKIDIKDLNAIKLKFHNKGIKVSNFTASNNLLINIPRLILIFLSLFLFIVIIKFFPYIKNNIDKTFVFIGVTFGFLFIILTPVCLVTSYDDQVHFHRMYTLLDGKSSNWTYAGRYFNHLVIGNHEKYKSYEEIKLYKQFLNENNDKKSEIKVDNMDSNIDYTDLIYLPFSIGYKIASVLGFSFVNCIYISKLFNLIFYIIIMYFAIRIIPFAKKIVFFIGLLPTNIYLASQFSYDSTITAGVIISFAAFLNIRNNEKVDLKNLLVFVLGITWASLPKVIYCPLLLLLLFIPTSWFNSKNQAKIIKIGIIILFLLTMSTFVLPVLTSSVAGDSRVEGTSVAGQFKHILSNPLSYGKLLVIETIDNFDSMFFGYNTFSRLGYLNGDTYFFDLSNFVLLFTILYLTFTDAIDKRVIDKKQKLILSILLIGIWCLIWSALYLSWTPVGAPRISGVQSRYFIPILVPLLIMFIPNSKKTSARISCWLYAIPILILSYSSLFIVLSYYK